MLFCVQHLVRQLVLFQHAREQLGIFDRSGADQHRLIMLVAVLDRSDDGVVLFIDGLVYEVLAVVPDHRLVRRHHQRFQTVDLLELVGLGVGGAGHAGELAVHAEIVLKGDGGERLVFVLDRDVLFRLDRLVQTVGPAPPRHQAPGELVDDDDLALLHHVVRVAQEQVVRSQRRVQVVHQVNEGRLVQAAPLGQEADAREQLLGLLVAGFRQQHLARFFVHGKIPRTVLLHLAHQQRRHFVHAVIQIGVILGLAGDDERSARFVDQDRVDLVDNGEFEAALVAVGHLHCHVVAQVVKPELVVGAVGDVGGVSLLLHVGGALRQVHPDRESEETVDAAHPVGVAARQVIVYRDDVHAQTRQRIQIGRQRCHQGLTFAGTHLGNLAGVQNHAANQLHVEMAHIEHALSRFAHHGKGLGQQAVQHLALGQPRLELRGLGAQRLVRQRGNCRLQHIDALHGLAVTLDEPVVTGAENASEDSGEH